MSQDGFRWQLLHSPRFSVNQDAPRFLERKRFVVETPSREYLSDEFGKDTLSAEVLKVYFHFIVMLKISFIPRIEFTYSTGGPLLIMSSPMS
jgi:hypothetical protein